MLKRTIELFEVNKALKRSRVVALLGPRQCGKTTLARSLVAEGDLNYFDLENPRHLARLQDAMMALEALRGVVVIDEVQHRPDLFPVLRVLSDREGAPATRILPAPRRAKFRGAHRKKSANTTAFSCARLLVHVGL